jgi:hypothetical protein
MSALALIWNRVQFMYLQWISGEWPLMRNRHIFSGFRSESMLLPLYVFFSARGAEQLYQSTGPPCSRFRDPLQLHSTTDSDASPSPVDSCLLTCPITKTETRPITSTRLANRRAHAAANATRPHSGRDSISSWVIGPSSSGTGVTFCNVSRTNSTNIVPKCAGIR